MAPFFCKEVYLTFHSQLEHFAAALVLVHLRGVAAGFAATLQQFSGQREGQERKAGGGVGAGLVLK